MARKVTLFIEDTDIKLLVATGKQVEKWARLPLEPGLVSDGVILDEAQVAGKLKELFKLAKVGMGKVIAGISGLNSLYRLITLPELPEAVVTEAVRHEAKRVIPVSLDQLHLSYQAVPATRGETHLFLAASPRNTVDAFRRTLRQAGLEPYIMDLAPLALCRTVNEPRAIIINVSSANLDIAVMADRVPQVIRSLYLPGEAESLSEKLSFITEELERTITFYNSSHLEKPLNPTVPIFVCGDLAQAPESWQSLVVRLNYSISLLPSPLESPEGFDPSQFMVNIGLALKELLPEKSEANFSLVNLNIMPKAYQPKPIPLAKILTPIGIAVGISLLVYMASSVRDVTASNAALHSQLPPIESLIAKNRSDIAALQKQIEPIKATGDAFKTTFASLERGREEVDEDLNKVVYLLPAKVNLTEVHTTGDSVTVSGTASDEDNIFTYARHLKGRFSTVIISSIEKRDETDKNEELELNYDFELSLEGTRHGYFYTAS